MLWLNYTRLHLGCEIAYSVIALLQHMSLKHTSRIFFLAPKYLPPCQPYVTVILPILLATLSATGPIILRPSGALLPTSQVFSPTDRWGHCTQLWSAICNHSSKALLPTSEAFLGPVLGAHARCVCTIRRDDHIMTPPKKNTLYVKKAPNSLPLQAPPPPSPMYKVH